MPASLKIKPMRSCPLSHDTPEMLVAAVVDARLASTSKIDAPIHLGLAG